MVRVALVDFWPVMLITFFYVKDEYGHNHGRTSQACGRRMAYHMLRAPALKEVSVDVKVSLEARQRFLRQHPDKGRTDLLVLFSFIKDSWYQKSWSEREKVNIFREAGLADGYSVGAIRKILCYEYAF